MNTEIKKFAAIVSKLGAFAVDNEDVVDQQTGAVTTRNRLGFLQDRLLNSICYTLANMNQTTRSTTLPKAKDRLRDAVESYRGDEISINKLNSAKEWVERLQEQILLVDQLYETAAAVYHDSTGKPFQFGRRHVVDERGDQAIRHAQELLAAEV